MFFKLFIFFFIFFSICYTNAEIKKFELDTASYEELISVPRI